MTATHQAIIEPDQAGVAPNWFEELEVARVDEVTR
jgi:hypothetical protein